MNPENKIPKRIWQTHRYKDVDSLPLYMKGPSLSWGVKNPSFEYSYIGIDSFNESSIEKFGEEWALILDKCESPVIQSDVWRVLHLYEHGGFYADMDTICLNPIDSIFERDSDFCIKYSLIDENPTIKTKTDVNESRETSLIVDSNGRLVDICNSIFATKPKGEIISLIVDTMRDECMARIRKRGGLITNHLTGSIAFANAYKTHPNSRDIVNPVDTILFIDLMGSYFWNDFGKVFNFSDLPLVYRVLKEDSKNEIKFFNSNGHGGVSH